MIALASILISEIPRLIEMIVYRTCTIFEVVIGLWLLIMGVNVKKKELAVATQEQIEIATESQIDAEILD
jgi:Na+/H+ antiporter NhaC